VVAAASFLPSALDDEFQFGLRVFIAGLAGYLTSDRSAGRPEV
jgi:hypothetical protein